jgi:hypothetical protein
MQIKICFRTTKFIRYENLPIETATGETVNVEFVSNVFSVNNNKIIQCIVRDYGKTGTVVNGQSGCPLPSAFGSKEGRSIH